MKNITIVGMGLIGSSFGKALRAEGGNDVQIVGYDSNREAHDQARKIGAVDRAEWNLDVAVRDADIVIIATPPIAIYDVFEAIAPYLKEGATVTDTAITKRAVLDWAEEMLPQPVGFVGGNPLIGAAGSGQANSSEALFRGSRYAVVSSPRAPRHAIETVIWLVEKVGARPIFMDPDEHDSYSAAVGGLPTIVSAAAMNAAAKSPSWPEISKFVGRDFSHMSEPSSKDPASAYGLAATNPDMVSYWIDEVVNQLQHIKQALNDEETRFEPDGALASAFVNAWENRLRLEIGMEPGSVQRDPLPSASESMATLFLGGRAAKALLRARASEEDRTRYDRRRLG